MSLEQEVAYLADLLARQHLGGFASDHLASFLRSHRELAPEARERLGRLFYALVRNTRRLAFAFAPEGCPPAQQVRLYFAAQDRLDPRLLGRFHPEADWERALRRFRTLEGVTEPSQRWGLVLNLSPALARVLLDTLGAEAEAFLEAVGQPPPRTLRANRLKGTRESLAARLEAQGFESEPTRWAEDGLLIRSGGDLFRTEAFQDGAFEMQDEGSQLIAELVAPPPGGLVVDACAGAGGKSLALASRLGGRGRVVALDIHGHKLEALRERARRAGASNVEAVRIEPEGPLPPRVLEHLERADRVLVDAPCSGLGVLRRNPEAGARLEPQDLARFPPLQAAILDRFVPLLRPGARLIYATCTVLPAENQDLVAQVNASHPSLEPVRATEILGGARGRPVTEASGFALRLRPELHGSDGFFAAVWRRRR